ncbi:sulfur oxidation c-type cytochrome SoxX [Bradyrhizobium liaoningense]|nr:sulfur oxidation c-type cytochrome SoxX [Bradyrhizobium liaoningense]
MERALTRRCAPTSPASGRGKWSSRLDLSSHIPSIVAAVITLSLALALPTQAEELVPYTIVGDGIPDSLTGSPGDAARGRALVLARTTTCILCHSGPFPETRFQGDLAPDLGGAGNRWSVSQLRLRLVDASRFNPETIMPSYYRNDGLVRVRRNFAGKPILSAAEIEDIVAFLATLRD